jgi:hypothetical protein
VGGGKWRGELDSCWHLVDRCDDREGRLMRLFLFGLEAAAVGSFFMQF